MKEVGERRAVFLFCVETFRIYRRSTIDSSVARSSSSRARHSKKEERKKRIVPNEHVRRIMSAPFFPLATKVSPLDSLSLSLSLALQILKLTGPHLVPPRIPSGPLPLAFHRHHDYVGWTRTWGLYTRTRLRSTVPPWLTDGEDGKPLSLSRCVKQDPGKRVRDPATRSPQGQKERSLPLNPHLVGSAPSESVLLASDWASYISQRFSERVLGTQRGHER